MHHNVKKSCCIGRPVGKEHGSGYCCSTANCMLAVPQEARWSVHVAQQKVKHPIAQAQVLGPPLSFHPESSVQVSTSTSINRTPPPINHHISFRDFPLHAIKQPPLQFHFVPFHQASKFLLITVNNSFSGIPFKTHSPHRDIQLVARCSQTHCYCRHCYGYPRYPHLSLSLFHATYPIKHLLPACLDFLSMKSSKLLSPPGSRRIAVVAYTHNPTVERGASF